MDWPTNFPPEVITRMRELYEANVHKDYYGAKMWGSTGWFETDEMLPADWKPIFA